MDANILSVKALFQKDIRYIIPPFQRPYVWDQESQWEPLWEDVRNKAEGYLDELSELKNEAKAEQTVGAHFFGAIVLQQQSNATADIETRNVVDGQQRITTLQLLLDAAGDALESEGFPKESKLLKKLVTNDPDLIDDEPESTYKIWPTQVDRNAFVAAMSHEGDAESEASPIVQAHEFFASQIKEWLKSDPNQSVRKASGLVTSLMGLIRMVVIDLETNDDANAIFETLNARGTPLQASDLIKNLVLHLATGAGMKQEVAHQKFWQTFDDKWWREDIRQGRLNRPRIDVYLNYWLTMRTTSDVLSGDVFPSFEKYVTSNGNTVSSVATDMVAVSGSYKLLEDTANYNPLGIFLYHWRVVDAGVSTPLIMWLFTNRHKIGDVGFFRSLDAIESFLIRRMACRLTTKDYNHLFLELLGIVDGGAPSVAPKLILDFFSKQTVDSRIWPTDRQVTNAFVTLPLYRSLTRGRLRIILESMEDKLRTPKTEEEHVLRGHTIEHLMPQKWQTHWPLPEPSNTEAIEARDAIVHTIGNLTLTNGVLNPALSNGGWPTKRKLLKEHSVLRLNNKLLLEHEDAWDDDLIRERSRQLAALACSIWKRST